MDAQKIMQKIGEAREEERRLSEELSSIDQMMRNDSIDFGHQRAGVAEGRSDRPIGEILAEERDRMRELRARREELPYLVHSAMAHRLRLEVKLYELREKEAGERRVAASKNAKPIREKLEALQRELDEVEGPMNLELANEQMAQTGRARKEEELENHMNTAPQRLPEFIAADTRV